MQVLLIGSDPVFKRLIERLLIGRGYPIESVATIDDAAPDPEETVIIDLASEPLTRVERSSVVGNLRGTGGGHKLILLAPKSVKTRAAAFARDLGAIVLEKPVRPDELDAALIASGAHARRVARYSEDISGTLDT